MVFIKYLQDHYRLKVLVKDLAPNNPLTSTGTIGIIVLDVNDNSPQFIKPPGLLMPSKYHY